MKIFLISNMYPSQNDVYYGIFVKNFKDSMINHGLEIKEEALILGRGKNISTKIFKYLLFYLEILYKGIFGKYDLIYVHNITHTCIPLIILRTIKKKKIVMNPHGEDILTNSRISQTLLKIALPLLTKSDLIVVPSVYFKNLLMNKFGIVTTRIFVSPSGGIDPSFYIKNYLKPPGDIFRIGFISRLDTKKGFDTLLKSLHCLRDRYSFKCTFVGKGQEQNLFFDQIKKLNLGNTVDYEGHKAQQHLPEIISEFDLFIFPTLYKESLGLVGLEALAGGVPVIGSEIGGLKDYLVEGYNGFFFKPGDEKDLSEKIDKYISLPLESKMIMRKNARHSALPFQKNSISIKLYEKLISI